jgi:hypothetical protein
MLRSVTQSDRERLPISRRSALLKAVTGITLYVASASALAATCIVDLSANPSATCNVPSSTGSSGVSTAEPVPVLPKTALAALVAAVLLVVKRFYGRLSR